MTQSLSADTGRQKQIANQLSQISATQRQNVQACMNEADSLRPNFQGASGSAFQAQVQRFDENGRQLMQKLEEISSNVQQASGTYESTDSGAASSIGSHWPAYRDRGPVGFSINLVGL